MSTNASQCIQVSKLFLLLIYKIPTFLRWLTETSFPVMFLTEKSPLPKEHVSLKQKLYSPLLKMLLYFNNSYYTEKNKHKPLPTLFKYKNPFY